MKIVWNFRPEVDITGLLKGSEYCKKKVARDQQALENKMVETLHTL